MGDVFTSSNSCSPFSLYRRRVGSFLGPAAGSNKVNISSFRFISTSVRRISMISGVGPGAPLEGFRHGLGAFGSVIRTAAGAIPTATDSDMANSNSSYLQQGQWYPSNDYLCTLRVCVGVPSCTRGFDSFEKMSKGGEGSEKGCVRRIYETKGKLGGEQVEAWRRRGR